MSLFENIFSNGWPYYCCHIENIMYGSAYEALYQHCGLENESKNNVVDG